MPERTTIRPALLLIDLMNHFDFPGGDALGRQATARVDAIISLRQRFDANDLPVVYVNDNWTQWRGEFRDLVERCHDNGGASAVLASRLAPEARHYHVLKPRHSGFMASALPALLAQLKVNALVLAGLASDACVLATALDAHMRQFRLWVPSDCSAAQTPARHDAALRLLRQTTGASTCQAMRRQGCFPETPSS
ncbi:MAG: isochorismatase family cysteine hydrolase [Pseudoxanthomonas suwonensis]|nr:isochorismatase family cysteine hydrolase [Pseudoxanthomonas suwonensis]